VGSVTVVEALEPVIDWHRRRLLPDSVDLAGNPRCRLVRDDFFALVAEQRSTTRYDVLLLDIDHTPDHVLHPRHADFYSTAGLHRLAFLLQDDGVFALWSDDPPEPGFLARLGQVFATTASHVVTFPNPHTRGVSSCTVYVAGQFRQVPKRPGSSRATP
jgi:spermidine synthase